MAADAAEIRLLVSAEGRGCCACPGTGDANHRRGTTIPGPVWAANRAASSKQARFIRHRRRFACFPHFLFEASKRKRPFTVKRKDASAHNWLRQMRAIRECSETSTGVVTKSAWLRFRLWRKLRQLPCSSFSHRKRCAGLRWEPGQSGSFASPRNQKKRQPFGCLFFWCARRDLNPHVRNGH